MPLSMSDTLVWGFFTPGHLWSMNFPVNVLLEQGIIPTHTNEINYPAGGAITIIGWSFILILLLCKVMGTGLIMGMNIAFLIHMVLAFYFAYRLALRLTDRWAESIVGGIAYGFCPFVISLVWNGQLAKLSHGFLPLAVLLLIEIAETKKFRPVLLLAPVFALTVATSPYMGIFSALFLLMLGSYYLVRSRGGNFRRIFLRLAISAFLVALASFPYISYWQDSHFVPGYQPLFVSAGPQFPPYSPNASQNATLLGWVKPKDYKFTPGELPKSVLHTHYIGWMFILLGALAFIPGKKKIPGKERGAGGSDMDEPPSRLSPKILLLFAGLFFIFAHGYSLRFTLEWDTIFGRRIFLPPYWLLRIFGDYFSFTVFYRAVIGVVLCGSMLVSIGLARITKPLGNWVRYGLCLFAGVALCVDALVVLPLPFPLPTHKIHLPMVYKDLARIDDQGAVLEAPYDSDEYRLKESNLRYFYFQVYHGHPTILADRELKKQGMNRFYFEFENGMFGKEKNFLSWDFTPAPLDFTYVILHVDYLPESKRARVINFLDGHLDLFKKYPKENIRLYKVRALPPEADKNKTWRQNPRYRYYMNSKVSPGGG